MVSTPDDHLFLALYRMTTSPKSSKDDHFTWVLYGRPLLPSSLRTTISPKCFMDVCLFRVLYGRQPLSSAFYESPPLNENTRYLLVCRDFLGFIYLLIGNFYAWQLQSFWFPRIVWILWIPIWSRCWSPRQCMPVHLLSLYIFNIQNQTLLYYFY